MVVVVIVVVVVIGRCGDGWWSGRGGADGAVMVPPLGIMGRRPGQHTRGGARYQRKYQRKYQRRNQLSRREPAGDSL